ncbi:NTF2 fold immunity protein [Photobacterium salinisoli]|uniref:NTF2 fold immunity protein n=1 Tax=Photobacterium salinisoli TaxID=1616783 RepID=UPI001F096CA8|nr:NTF2 fold immunity protein [Photobacterium salinisoli]
MSNKILTIFMALFSTLSYGNNMDSPKSLVQSFIADFEKWNDEAHSLSEAEVEYTGEAMKKAKELYQNNILSKYCFKGFVGEPIAFGSDSSHDPENEVIHSEKVEGNKALITTKHTGSFGFVSDYEYRLTKYEGRWYLEAVDYVDSEGKYPGL